MIKKSVIKTPVKKTQEKKASVKVMVFGTFDLLHKGHLYFLNEAKKHGDYLIVVVARDNTVEKIKNKKPVHAELERKHNIENTKIADKVILGEKELSYNCIINEKPDVICLGYDQNSQSVELKFSKIKYVRIPPYKPHKYKTSKIRK
jgi:FAD synthetase